MVNYYSSIVMKMKIGHLAIVKEVTYDERVLSNLFERRMLVFCVDSNLENYAGIYFQNGCLFYVFIEGILLLFICHAKSIDSQLQL